MIVEAGPVPSAIDFWKRLGYAPNKQIGLWDKKISPIEKVTQTTETRVISGSPISAQPFPIGQQRLRDEQETVIYTYPPSSPLKAPPSPSDDMGLYSPPVNLSRSAPISSDKITPVISLFGGRGSFETPFREPPQIGLTTTIIPIGVMGGTKTTPEFGQGSYTIPISTPIVTPVPAQDQPSIYETTTYQIPRQQQGQTTEQITIRPPYTPTSSMQKFYMPHGNLGGWGGGGERANPFLFGGSRKRRKEYPIVGAEDVLRSFI